MNRARASQLFTAAPPLLVTALVAKLWLTGTLGYYVNDRTVWIVLLGGFLFGVVGLIGARSVLAGGEHDAHVSLRTVAFALPALVGLLLPAHPLSATSGQSSSLGSLQLASHVAAGSSGDSFGTWIGALGSHPDVGWWSGQRVTLVGFTANQNGLPPHSVIVGRYLVTCCVVDATLLGFPVQIAHGALPPQGTWTQVSGTFGRQFWTDPSGGRWPIIQHARLSRVSVPSSPYLSP